MKKILFAGVAFVTFWCFNSCKKIDLPPNFKENCKLLKTTISVFSNYNTSYSYDQKGFVSSEETDMGDFRIRYDYSRKKDGEIISAQSFFDGEAGSVIKFTYESGRVVRLEEFWNNTPVGVVHNIRYNAHGLLIEFTDEFADYPQYSRKNLFEFNSLGQMTKSFGEDLNGNVQHYELYKIKGSGSLAAENYLMQHGLPFQLAFSYAFFITDPGIGTEVQTYAPNTDGKLVWQNTITLKSKTLNARGYTESMAYVDENGNMASHSEYLTQCNKGKVLD